MTILSSESESSSSPGCREGLPSGITMSESARYMRAVSLAVHKQRFDRFYQPESLSLDDASNISSDAEKRRYPF
jgi:hypothetical protein